MSNQRYDVAPKVDRVANAVRKHDQRQRDAWKKPTGATREDTHKPEEGARPAGDRITEAAKKNEQRQRDAWKR